MAANRGGLRRTIDAPRGAELKADFDESVIAAAFAAAARKN